MTAPAPKPTYDFGITGDDIRRAVREFDEIEKRVEKRLRDAELYRSWRLVNVPPREEQEDSDCT